MVLSCILMTARQCVFGFSEFTSGLKSLPVSSTISSVSFIVFIVLSNKLKSAYVLKTLEVN
jgi:hypothetical protein